VEQSSKLPYYYDYLEPALLIMVMSLKTSYLKYTSIGEVGFVDKSIRSISLTVSLIDSGILISKQTIPKHKQNHINVFTTGEVSSSKVVVSNDTISFI